MKIYDFSVKDKNGQMVSLEKYKGKVLLIVNTATRCGFTPQYEGLQHLYEKYNAEGFEILDFPCNQFNSQAPETNEGISSFCKLNYGITFPQFAKIEVNGTNADPVFIFLRKELNNNNLIKWNFTKFLINKDGNPIKIFESFETPEKIEQYILNTLK